MRYIISGGGTGGHIYPAISIAKIIKQNEPDAEILYVGTKTGLESEIVPKYGIDFATVRVSYLPRKIGLKLVKSFVELAKGFADSFKLISNFKPDAVIGTGGYVSFPIVFMAIKKKIPTVIHEANNYPGLTNKYLANRASAVCLTFKETGDKMKIKGKTYVTGNPIRPDFFVSKQEDFHEKRSLSKEKPIVISIGGSGGQKNLNNVIIKLIKNNLLNSDIQLVHVTGRRFYDEFITNIGEYNRDMYKIIPYAHEMPELMAIADLAITSSGMMTLTELSCAGLPSILIPKSYTAENHQEFNARAYEKVNASYVILENELNEDILADKINYLFNNREILKTMGNNSNKLFVKDSNSQIYSAIMSVTNR